VLSMVIEEVYRDGGQRLFVVPGRLPRGSVYKVNVSRLHYGMEVPYKDGVPTGWRYTLLRLESVL